MGLVASSALFKVARPMVGWGTFHMNSQVIDGELILDLLPVPMRDILKAQYQTMQV